MTSKTKTECHEPMCMMAHDLVNSLSVIVGNCDLLRTSDQSEDANARLIRIRDTATVMADTLRKHQCRMAVLMRAAPPSEQEVAG